MVNTNNNMINKFIKDVTSVAKFPMAKSEVRRRLNEIINQKFSDLIIEVDELKCDTSRDTGSFEYDFAFEEVIELIYKLKK